MTLSEVGRRPSRRDGYLKTGRGASGGTFVLSTQVRQLAKADIRRNAREMGSAVKDLIDLRGAVEPKAAELAALRATPGKIENLRWLLERSRSAPLSQLRQADPTLHIAIAHSAESDLLLEAVLEVQGRLHDLLAYLSVAPKHQTARVRSSLQHADVVDAIADRDGLGARAAMDAHIMATREVLLELVGPGPACIPSARSRRPDFGC